MTRAISLQKLEESEYLLRTNNYRKGLGMGYLQVAKC